MEEEQIYTSHTDSENTQGDQNSKGNQVNTVLLGIIVFLLLVITGGSAYFLGVQNKGGQNDVPTPTQGLFKTQTLGTEVTPTVTPILTSTESASITPYKTLNTTPSPTVKPTSTPKPTSIPVTPSITPISTEF